MANQPVLRSRSSSPRSSHRLSVVVRFGVTLIALIAAVPVAEAKPKPRGEGDNCIQPGVPFFNGPACGSDLVCCLTGHPVVGTCTRLGSNENCAECGDDCGADGQCRDGQCCTASRMCGDQCCAVGEVCTGGECCHNLFVCGEECCNVDEMCFGGSTCCEPDEICGNQCGCPDGSECLHDACCPSEFICGSECCRSGTCVAGACVPPTGCECEPACPGGFACCCCAPGTESGGPNGTAACVDLNTGLTPTGFQTSFCGSCNTGCNSICSNGTCQCPDGTTQCPDTACEAPRMCCVLDESAWSCVDNRETGLCFGG